MVAILTTVILLASPSLVLISRGYCQLLQADGTARRHVGWQLILQLVAAVLLIGVLAIAIVGLSVRSHVGQECSWCDGFACPRIKWWDCQPASTISTGTSPVAEISSPVSESTPASSSNSNDTTLVTYG
jgi:hypothetical protein